MRLHVVRAQRGEGDDPVGQLHFTHPAILDAGAVLGHPISPSRARGPSGGRREAFGEPVRSPDAGSRVQFTLPVDDVDAMCKELTSRGVTLLNGPMDRPWGIRTASFKDPGGHIWEIAQ
ncbi:VOC family protein [Streptomyces antibioticus]